MLKIRAEFYEIGPYFSEGYKSSVLAISLVFCHQSKWPPNKNLPHSEQCKNPLISTTFDASISWLACNIWLGSSHIVISTTNRYLNKFFNNCKNTAILSRKHPNILFRMIFNFRDRTKTFPSSKTKLMVFVLQFVLKV